MLLQQQLIEKVKDLSLNTDNISAALMYGSFIKEEGDQYSDIEFYIFTRKNATINKQNWISEISPIDMFFTNEFGTDVVIFSNLIRGEFHFHSVEDIHIIKTWEGLTSFEFREKMNLVDKEGELSRILDSIELLTPIHNTQENIDWLAMSLINNILFGKNVLTRGESAHAYQIFSVIHKYILWLIRIRVSAYDHWESPTKKIKDDIPAEWYDKYVLCVPCLTEESMWQALSNTFDLSEVLFWELGVPDHIITILKRIKESGKKDSLSLLQQ